MKYEKKPFFKKLIYFNKITSDIFYLMEMF